MNQNKLRKIQELEKELLADVDTANEVLLLKEVQERTFRKGLLKSKSTEVIKQAIGDKIIDLETSIMNSLQEIHKMPSSQKEQNKNSLDDVVVAINEASIKSVHSNTDLKALLAALDRSIKLFSNKKLETKVEVIAPEPIVTTKVVVETKEAKETVSLLNQLIKAVTKQSDGLEALTQRVFILNNKPQQAIPVQLVNKRGDKYQDLSDISPLALVSGGGGSSNNGTPFNVFAEDINVVTATETIIISHIIAGITPAYVDGIIVSCGAPVKFKLKVNGTVKAVGRTSASHPTENVQFGNGSVRVSAADVITVTAYHAESGDQIVDANLYGTI